MITEPDSRTLRRVRSQAHPRCVVCGRSDGHGLKLRYVLCENGGVEADLPATDGLEGYPGILHGGIIATLLDGAMTQCLFAMGVEAVTADLHVRFRHPIHTDRPLRVLARLAEDRGGWYLLEAEAVQDDRIAALAKGTFMRSFRDH